MLPLLLIALSLSLVQADKLILSQIVFRHGARGSMERPTTKEAEEHFFRGTGQLTDEGIEQAYNLGKELRLRTQDLIDMRMIPNQFEFESSPSDRCIQTAQAVGMGLFNNTKSGLSRVVPVHSIPVKDNWFLFPNFCDSMTRELGEELGMAGEYNYYQVLKYKFEKLCKVSRYWEDPSHCRKIEAYTFENDAKLAVPDWLDEDAQNEGKKLRSEALHYISGSGKYKNSMYIQQRIGLLLDKILNRINDTAEAYASGNNYKKLYAYSTHDIMIMPLADAIGLNIFYDELPTFVGALLIELWEIDEEFKVKFFYRRDSGSFLPITRNVGICGNQEICNISDVVDCCSDYRHPEPWKLCGTSGFDSSSRGISVILALCIAVIGCLY
ncbi:unnamed protein product [Auanema sp. JU1783]|nr:unnamed protein product [Auanema sp. JU1783]